MSRRRTTPATSLALRSCCHNANEGREVHTSLIKLFSMCFSDPHCVYPETI
jgi:hypothetical protein